MDNEKNAKDIDEPVPMTKVTTPDVRKRRRRILLLAGVCAVIVIVVLLVVVATIVLKDPGDATPDGSEGQVGHHGPDGVTSQTDEWSRWADCNVSCGVGRRIRVRNRCPPPTTTCDKEQTRTCRLPPCES